MTQLYELSELGRRLCGNRVELALADMAAKHVIERIWARDHTVWKPTANEISNRLGWLRIGDEMRLHLDWLGEFVQTLRAEGYTHAVFLGMGGSSLAPELFRKTFGARPAPSTWSCSTAPCRARCWLSPKRLTRTARCSLSPPNRAARWRRCRSSSSSTVSRGVGGIESAGEHFVAITDPGKPLADLATPLRLPHDVPCRPQHRRALLRAVLLRAGAGGADRVDLPRLLERAGASARTCVRRWRRRRIPVRGWARSWRTGEGLGRDKFTLVRRPGVAGFGDWVEQLIAESTGKEGKGILPVVGEPLAAPSLYSGDDRAFMHLRLHGTNPDDAEMAALEAAGQPVVRLGAARRL